MGLGERLRLRPGDRCQCLRKALAGNRPGSRTEDLAGESCPIDFPHHVYAVALVILVRKPNLIGMNSA